MGFGNILSSTDISSSGLAAERLRMEVVANNLANANSTSTPEGGAYQRQVVRFGSVMKQSMGVPEDKGSLGGVQVLGVTAAKDATKEVFLPQHPDAKPNGFVTMPNISVPNEMTDLLTASRTYEANLKSLTTFKEMAEQALSLMNPR